MTVTAHVLLGVYRPYPHALRQQVRSILEQDHPRIRVHIRIDGRDEAARQILTGMPDHVHVEEGAERLGVFGNYMSGLSSALSLEKSPDAVFAFCDQDDVWQPGKLSVQIAALQRSSAALCYCDASVIDADGRNIHPSLFEMERRTPHADLQDLLVRNDVSGHSMLITREAAAAACRSSSNQFAAGQVALLHDWWMALAARTVGSAVFLKEPLLQYRRHASNVMGPAPNRKKSARIWGGGIISEAFRAKSARHYALRAFLLEKLQRLQTAPSASAEFDKAAALFSMADKQLTPLLRAYRSAVRRGDCQRTQSLYMSLLGKTEILRLAKTPWLSRWTNEQFVKLCDAYSASALANAP
ncbi:MAG: glycosyltransferase [Hyphomicrobiales bacterium]|nr:glycosyltransferase [Hyphomicrobiales bacterium]